MFGEIVSGFLGYEGTKDTNDANQQVASARNAFEAEEAKKARNFSEWESQKKRMFDAGETKLMREFQERMSSSAVSRRMEDMKKAGINPILAGKYDASSPAGVAASAGIGATAKANAHGYTVQNKIQSLLDNLTVSAKLKKAIHDARISENTANVTEIGGDVGKDASSGYQKVKKAAENVGNFIGTTAADLQYKASKAVKDAHHKAKMQAKVGKINKQKKIISKKLPPKADKEYRVIGWTR